MTLEKLSISYKVAATDQEFGMGKNLIQQYANSLGVDLSFQDFAAELQTIHKQYNMPKGALLLAYNDEAAVGCVAIRELDSETAELKRMFVQPEFRKYKIGQSLLAMIIKIARELNYSRIRLDTLPDMVKAQDLYKTFGFYEIAPYRFNPVAGTIYMEKRIDEM
jgi:putative acetyltransferase